MTSQVSHMNKDSSLLKEHIATIAGISKIAKIRGTNSISLSTSTYLHIHILDMGMMLLAITSF